MTGTSARRNRAGPDGARPPTDPGGRVVGAIDSPKAREQIEQLEVVAEWMDRRYLDPLIGFLLPGAGNTISSLVGLYAIVVAARLRVHPIIIARMLLHLAIDSIIGSIPIFGWVGDFFYRAHVKNVQLVKARGETGEATRNDWFIVLLAAGLFLFALSLPLIIVAFAVYTLFSVF